MNLLTQILNYFKAELQIYTDGSQKGQWGSWAFVVTQRGRIIHEASGRVRKADNNRMEFQAAIEALSYLKAGAKACVHSDSRVLIEAVQSTEDRPFASEDQLERLDGLLVDRQVAWTWVKAHSGNRFNERCDELCIAARVR
ncbi:MAG: ribonuclease HI [Bdellovibrionaceae bacterium]|nr:ribonuclease HI [Pseudobdellovibrionaceae bacterium]